MTVQHYYHIYADGAWSEPVREHAEALGKAGFDGAITIGIVGSPGDRIRVRELTLMRFADAGVPAPVAWIEADTGYEQITLSALRDEAIHSSDDHPVLYAHTKGARDNSQWNGYWRQSMTNHVVGGWRRCVKLLAKYDTVGCHWLTPEEYHNPPDYIVDTPFYGGNFWWARSSYLRKLPHPSTETRYRAEEWIGLAHPRAYDLLPGWPSMKICAPGERITEYDR